MFLYQPLMILRRKIWTILVGKVDNFCNVTFKSYIAVFICMRVKAVHLELVSSLDTDSFLAAFNRFISRRRRPERVISDNGRNFIGAANKLKEFFNNGTNGERINRFCTEKEIKWSFIPLHAPHFGGLWECTIKSAKKILVRVGSNNVFTYKEFSTVLANVEACLNSRPLCELSDDPSDLQALTASHFLVLKPLLATPTPSSVTSQTILLQGRWKSLQKIVSNFWSQWRAEYVSSLQTRSKWQGQNCNVRVNDLVLVKEDNQALATWSMGRVIEVYPGPDALVRVARVKTVNGKFLRSVTKLAVLSKNAVKLICKISNLANFKPVMFALLRL